MTPRDLAYEALNYISASGSPDTITQAGNRKLQRIADDLTATLQEITRTNPEIYKTERGQGLLAPEAVSVAATLNSSAVTFTGTFVNGSKISLTGDPELNEVRLEVADKKLLMPYVGPTGTVAGTLYHDMVLLDDDATQLIGQPFLVGFGYLDIAHNKQQLVESFGRGDANDYGRRRRYRSTNNKLVTGQPTRFYVENYYDTSSNLARSRMQVYPIPDRAYRITYFVALKARRLTIADLGTDAVDSAFVLPIQDDYVESIVKPIFLAKFTGSPWFRDDPAKAKIIQDAKDAKQMLSSMKRQGAVNRTIRGFR